MKKDKQVNRLITIIMIIFFIIIVIVINASAQVKTGYLVSVDYNYYDMIIHKVRTEKQVNEILLKSFTKYQNDIKEGTKKGVSFDMRVYVELKRVTKKGKYKRLKRKEIKEIERKLK